MRKLFNARGIGGAFAFASAIGLAACGADVGPDGYAEGEIGSTSQAIGTAGLTNAPSGVIWPAMVKLDTNKTLVVGGFNTLGAAVNDVSIFDKTLNAGAGGWTPLAGAGSKAQLPANKQRGKAEIRLIPGTTDKYLLAGGSDGTNALSDSLIYNATADTWTAVAGSAGLTAAMNSARFGFSLSPCGNAGNGELIAIGGITTEAAFGGPGASAATNKMDVFTFVPGTPANSGWAPLKNGTPATLNLTTDRGFHQTFESGTQTFYVAGGLHGSATPALKSVERIVVSATCDTAVKTARANMAVTVSGVTTDYPRAKFAAIPFGGKFVVAGGTADYDLVSVPTQAIAYDPATDTWSLAGLINAGRIFPLASGVDLAGGAVPGIVGGGASVTNELYNTVTTHDVYAGETNATVWGTGTALLVGRVAGWLNDDLLYGHGMTVANGANTFRLNPE